LVHAEGCTWTDAWKSADANVILSADSLVMTRGIFRADFSTVIKLVEVPPTQLVNANCNWYEREPGNAIAGIISGDSVCVSSSAWIAAYCSALSFVKYVEGMMVHAADIGFPAPPVLPEKSSTTPSQEPITVCGAPCTTWMGTGGSVGACTLMLIDPRGGL
jgi:hypothetical protein